MTANGERTTYRADGWPCCPGCGEDELFSVLMMRWDGEDERPTLAACFEKEFRCYACRWAGYVYGPEVKP